VNTVRVSFVLASCLVVSLCAGAAEQHVANAFSSLPAKAQASISAAMGRDSWVQLAELTESDGEQGDQFGGSIAISGDTVVVGAIKRYSSGVGAVYVFVKPKSGWRNMRQVAELTASESGTSDWLGYSVSIDGDTVVAGAPNASPGFPYQGEAYVWVKPKGGWRNMIETARLTVTGGVSRIRLGTSISVSGNTVAVGAPRAKVGRHLHAGAVFVFVKPANGWRSTKQTAKLSLSGGYGLGLSVSVSGNALVTVDPGTAYVFVRPSTGWANTTIPTATLSTTDAASAFSVGIEANTIITGAIDVDQHQGAAYVYVEPQGGWTNMSQTAKLTASDGKAGDGLGYSVSVHGRKVVAGACYKNQQQGAAYLYIKPPSGWENTTETAELVASDGKPNQFFGLSVGVAADTVVAGAPDNTKSGAAYVFGNQ